MTHAPGFNTIEQFASEQGGVLLLDKPATWTSFDVVKKVRGTLRVRKVGHAGTLDPMATGLLVLCSGPMTKRIDTYQVQEKTYTGTLRLGAVTPSFDAETPPTDEKPYDGINTEVLRNTTVQFTGEIRQIPPMYSAVKVDGKRLYALARKGEEVEREARIVRVHRFDIDNVNLPDVDFTVICSKGTYVRTLVHDMGQTLGCGAYLTALRRTAIGTLNVSDAWTVDAIVETAERFHPGSRSKEDSHARSSQS